MVPANSRRIPRAPRYSGYRYQSYSYLYGAFTLYGLTFQTGSSSNTSQMLRSYYPDNAETLSVWAIPRSLATTCGITIVFSSWGYWDVSVPRVRLIHRMITGLQPAELPHSEMSGSKVVCTYPNLIAAYHVLHRLLEPRHPPFALSFFFYVKLLVLINLGSPRMT